MSLSREPSAALSRMRARVWLRAALLPFCTTACKICLSLSLRLILRGFNGRHDSLLSQQKSLNNIPKDYLTSFCFLMTDY